MDGTVLRKSESYRVNNHKNSFFTKNMVFEVERSRFAKVHKSGGFVFFIDVFIACCVNTLVHVVFRCYSKYNDEVKSNN